MYTQRLVAPLSCQAWFGHCVCSVSFPARSSRQATRAKQAQEIGPRSRLTAWQNSAISPCAPFVWEKHVTHTQTLLSHHVLPITHFNQGHPGHAHRQKDYNSPWHACHQQKSCCWLKKNYSFYLQIENVIMSFIMTANPKVFQAKWHQLCTVSAA